MDTPTALDELVKSFSEWRANKKTRAERLPPELLRRARELRGGQFSDREICKRTGLNPYKLPSSKPKKKDVPEFIEIPQVMASEPVVVEIHDGEKSIIIRLPSVDVEKLLSHFYV
jgi:hypothetical protein